MMQKCSPVEMRKNLEVVEQLRKHGIDFVCIPAVDQKHKDELIAQGQKAFERMAKQAEDGTRRVRAMLD